MFEDSLSSISSQLKKAKKSKLSATENNLEPEYHVEEREKKIKLAVSKAQAQEKEMLNKAYKEDRYQATQPKKKTYPERTFDQFVQKGARLHQEDINILKAFCGEISSSRRFLHPDERPIKRITDNTVIRILVNEFGKYLESDLGSIDFTKIQTEDDLRFYISRIFSNVNEH